MNKNKKVILFKNKHDIKINIYKKKYCCIYKIMKIKKIKIRIQMI